MGDFYVVRRGSTSLSNKVILSGLGYEALGILLVELSLRPGTPLGYREMTGRGAGESRIRKAHKELEAYGFRHRYLIRVDGRLRTITVVTDEPCQGDDLINEIDLPPEAFLVEVQSTVTETQLCAREKKTVQGSGRHLRRSGSAVKNTAQSDQRKRKQSAKNAESENRRSGSAVITTAQSTAAQSTVAQFSTAGRSPNTLRVEELSNPSPPSPHDEDGKCRNTASGSQNETLRENHRSRSESHNETLKASGSQKTGFQGLTGETPIKDQQELPTPYPPSPTTFDEPPLDAGTPTGDGATAVATGEPDGSGAGANTRGETPSGSPAADAAAHRHETTQPQNALHADLSDEISPDKELVEEGEKSSERPQYVRFRPSSDALVGEKCNYSAVTPADSTPAPPSTGEPDMDTNAVVAAAIPESMRALRPADAAKVATVIRARMRAGWTPAQIRHVLESRPLPPKVRHLTAFLLARLRDDVPEGGPPGWMSADPSGRTVAGQGSDQWSMCLLDGRIIRRRDLHMGTAKADFARARISGLHADVTVESWLEDQLADQATWDRYLAIPTAAVSQA